MGVCCVPLCTNNTRNSAPYCLYRFPTDEKKRKKWLDLIRRGDFVWTEHSRICSWHFPHGKKDGPKRFPWNMATWNRLETPKKRDRGMTIEEENEDLRTKYEYAMKELAKVQAQNKKLSLRITAVESVFDQVASVLLKCNYDAV